MFSLTNTLLLPALALLSAACCSANAKDTAKPAAPAEAPAAPAPVKAEDKVKYAHRQLLVSFEMGTTSAERESVYKDFGLVEVEKIGSGELYLAQTSEGVDIPELAKKVSKGKKVRYAEPNIMLKTLPSKPQTVK